MMTSEHYYRPPSIGPSLGTWLDRARQWDIEYGGYLSNHITHNWLVMSAAGADDALLQWWQDLYTYRLEAQPARVPGHLEAARPVDRESPAITRESWRDAVQSSRERFPAFRVFFDERLAKEGLEATLRRFLPALLPGLAGAALHPVIHTGWGLQAGHLGTVADGLAYMATAFQPLASGAAHGPPTPLWSHAAPGPVDATLAFLGRALEQDLVGQVDAAVAMARYRALDLGLFQPRIIAFDDPALGLGASLNAAGPLGLPAAGASIIPALEELMALIAAATLASDGEFFVIHGLTSLHAVASLASVLPGEAQRDALTHWWRVAMATLVAQRLPGLDTTVELLTRWRRDIEARNEQPEALRPAARARWLEALRGALHSYDEHIPKAIYALWQWAEWGVFRPSTVELFARAAQHLGRAHPSGEVHRNLSFSVLG